MFSRLLKPVGSERRGCVTPLGADEPQERWLKRRQPNSPGLMTHGGAKKQSLHLPRLDRIAHSQDVQSVHQKVITH